MTLFRSMSIRSGLVLLALLAVLPALALQIFDGMVLRRHLVRDGMAEARRAAAAMAQVQESITQSTRLLLATLSAMPEIRNGDRQACDTLFASLIKDNPNYLNILSADTRGNLVASGLPFGQVNIGDRRHFREALAQNRFASGEYIVSRTAFDAAFPFSHPVRDASGQPIAILTAAIRLSAYDAAFDQMRLPEGSILGITDRNGIRLYFRPQIPTNMPGNPIRAEVWQAMREAGDAGVALLAGSDGVRRYYAFQALRLGPGEPAYMYFVVGVPESAILAPARTALFHNVLLLAAAAGLALGVAWFVGGTVIANRLDRLADTAARIGRGELSARTGLPHADSGIGKAAASLDAMAELLAGHDAARNRALAALRQSQERMAHIAASMADWIWEIDEEDRYVHVSARVRQALGFEPEALIGKTPYQFLAPGEETAVRLALETAKAGREPVRDLLNWRLARNGGLRCMQTSGVPWFDEAGRFRGYRGVDKDVTEAIEAERALRASLEEKEILLKEIHHRVKNNLQIISGLLYLQEESVQDPVALESFRESRSRIASMALVHEEIYRSADLSRIRLDTYVQDLVPKLFGPMGRGPSLRLELELELAPIAVPIEQAVPAGLVVNELLTNAHKHAFAGRDSGRLRILLREQDGLVSILIGDDGPGLPEGFDPDRTGTLGMQLVANLARQLGGSVETGNDAGAVFILRFSR